MEATLLVKLGNYLGNIEPGLPIIRIQWQLSAFARWDNNMNDQKPVKRDNQTNLLSLNPHDTFIVENKLALRRMLGLEPADDETDASTPDKVIMLLIRGMTERLVLTDNLSVVLGRADIALGFKPDVDLTPYGASSRGVSRSHARLHLQDHQLFITDLESANGTFMGTEKLSPNQAYPLHAGTNLLLGALSIQVMFS